MTLTFPDREEHRMNHPDPQSCLTSVDAGAAPKVETPVSVKVPEVWHGRIHRVLPTVWEVHISAIDALPQQEGEVLVIHRGSDPAATLLSVAKALGLDAMTARDSSYGTAKETITQEAEVTRVRFRWTGFVDIEGPLPEDPGALEGKVRKLYDANPEAFKAKAEVTGYKFEREDASRMVRIPATIGSRLATEGK
jgi:hypothetical protein